MDNLKEQYKIVKVHALSVNDVLIEYLKEYTLVGLSTGEMVKLEFKRR